MTRTALLLMIAAIGACSPGESRPLVATEARVTAPRTEGGMSAGYLTLHNGSDDEIVITRVSSPQFGRVEMHESRVEDGVSRMRPIDVLAIPSGGDVALVPGGRHLMLMQPAGPADTVTLELWSGDALLLTLDAPVADH